MTEDLQRMIAIVRQHPVPWEVLEIENKAYRLIDKNQKSVIEQVPYDIGMSICHIVNNYPIIQYISRYPSEK